MEKELEERYKDVIGFDFQGFPERKMTVRKIIEELGFKYNEETNKYEISGDDEVLDLYPRKLEDDGMGYGVNEECITEVYVSREDKYVNIFIEKPTENIEIYIEDRVYPGCYINIEDNTWFVDRYNKETDSYDLTEFVTEEDEGDGIKKFFSRNTKNISRDELRKITKRKTTD